MHRGKSWPEVKRVTRFSTPDGKEHETHSAARSHWSKKKAFVLLDKTLNDEFGSYLPINMVPFLLEHFDIKPKKLKVAK